ncbi:MAG TPA: PIN domain-containing protein [Thermoguttaceae bacterium]|nr:PIN domain-containing protein [Thermoguttaceae bacterium]
MDGKFLLDTNVAIGLLKGDGSILRHLEQETRVLLSTVVLGELYYGARKSTRVEDNLARIHRLAANTVVLGCDLALASRDQHFAEVDGLTWARW